MTTLPIALSAAKPFDYFADGQNIREIQIDEAIRELARSVAANGYLQPVGAIDYGEYGEPM